MDAKNQETFNFLVFENVYLFKSYLFVKIIKKKLFDFEKFVLFNKIETKLLLKIIDLCLINNKSLDTKNNLNTVKEKEIFKKIYNFLLKEYLRVDEDADKKFQNKNFETNINESEADIINLLSEIQTFTILEETNSENSQNNSRASIWSSLKEWIHRIYENNRIIKSLNSFKNILTPLTNVQFQESLKNNQNVKGNLIFLHIFSLTDKMKIEDLMLKILDFIIIRAKNELDFNAFGQIYKENEQTLNELTDLVDMNKNLNNSLDDSSILVEDLIEQENNFIKIHPKSFLPSASSSHTNAKDTSNKRKRRETSSSLELNEKNVSIASLESLVNNKKSKTKQETPQNLYTTALNDSFTTFRSYTQDIYKDDTNGTDEECDSEKNNQMDINDDVSNKQVVYLDPEFNHSPTYHKFWSNFKMNSNIEKHISMPYDLLFKFHPLVLSVHRLPGIGQTYASRLKQKNINTFGDFVNFYQLKCKNNDDLFHDGLKSMIAMKIDSINKILNLIKSYSIQVKSL